MQIMNDETEVDPQVAHYSSAARLERLPISSFHRQIVWVLGFVFFFELGDINTFSFAAPAILQQWHLSITTISIIVSATFLGMFIGAVSGGWLSDRVGRKRALISSTLWYSVFSLLNAFAWNPAGLFGARMLTGMGLSAMTVVGITYISEMFPAAKRGTYQGRVMAIGLLGITATAYVARYLIPIVPWGWRLVFVWGSLGSLILLFGRRLEESPRWYEKRGRTDQEEAVLARIEERVRAECGELPAPTEQTLQKIGAHSYRDLFSPEYVRQTVVLIFAYIGQTLGFYGFMAWVPTLLVAHGFSLLNSLAWSSTITIGAVPGALLAALVSDRWERKWLITIVALVIAVCGIPYGMSFKTTAIIIFGFLVAMFIQTFAPLLYAYTPEAYPTEIRNSGAGLVYGVGRLANTVGPLLVAFFYKHYGYTYVFVYISACWMLVAVAVGGFGLKTTGRELEQLSEPPAAADAV
jgi:MFS transporter, putative metabolite:H+ symporter